VQAYQLLEQRVEERTREIKTLLDITRNVASTLELQPLLNLILEQLKGVVDYQNAGLYTIDGDTFISEGYRGPLQQEAVLHRRIPFSLLPLHTKAVRDQVPFIIDDLHTMDPHSEFGEGAALILKQSRDKTCAWLGVPLIVKDRVIGMLSMSSEQPGYYSERHADLAMAIATQAAVALENAKLYERAQEVATLEERQRLARELHDSVSQALYSIGLAANAARLLIDRDPPQAAAPLDYLIALAEAGMTEMRALIFELRPDSLEQEGLIAALEKQAAALSARHRIAVISELGAEPALPLEVKEALYRIGQEALHNVVKHARAKQVEIRLAVNPEKVILRVADDGKGFHVDGAFPGHLGLRSMRERAARLDGALEIISTPGQGTCVCATIPFCPPGLKERWR
jgi:signal transduction histidine kinase